MGISRRGLAAWLAAESLLDLMPIRGWALTSRHAERNDPAALGVITTNDPADFTRFGRWLGRTPALAHLYFNQDSVDMLAASIDYICKDAAAFKQGGAQIFWSVPCPGPRQLEAIANGVHDALYRRLFGQIVAVSGDDVAPILVRLPWEFNLAEQPNAARAANGAWSAEAFIAAWRHLADLAHAISPRFQRVWCPNVGRHAIDPELCYPGDGYVDVVAQDFYLQTRYDQPGSFGYFLTMDRGLAWCAAFARRHGKPYGLSEWGLEGDRYVGDLATAAQWIATLGPTLHHHCWWDRPEVIDCRISDGTHPQLAAAYKARFGA